jgi:3-oxoacyl-[acyl-carrier protein] reductase
LLNPKRAIVFGSSKGIGHAITARLIRDGWDVIGLSRTPHDFAVPWYQFDADQPLEAIEVRIRRLIHGLGRGLREDDLGWYLSRSGQAPGSIRTRWMLERLGAPDLVVVAAGVGAYSLWNAWTSRRWHDKAGKLHLGIEDILRVNLISKMVIAKEFLLSMRRRRAGTVILIGSVMASYGDHGAEAYAASQAGLRGFVASAHKHPAKRGVCLALAEPGWTKTPMSEVLPEWKKRAAEKQFGPFLEAWDVADRIVDRQFKPGEIFPIERKS